MMARVEVLIAFEGVGVDIEEEVTLDKGRGGSRVTFVRGISRAPKIALTHFKFKCNNIALQIPPSIFGVDSIYPV